MADYERIHAKIVRGVNRQIEGDKEVEDGLREMISSKAYLKHYKSIAAYAEHEFGKSKGWVYERIRIRLPITDVNKAPCAPADQVPNSTSNREEVALKKVEAARVQSQGPDSEEGPPPKPKVEPVKDKTGVVVPARCLQLTERRQEVTEMEYHASKLAALFEKLQTNNDVLYSQLRASGNIQTYMNHASTMRYTISHCIPDVVCPACKGDGKARTIVKERDWCHECAGSGMISEVKWNREWVKSGDRLKLAEVERRRNGS